MSKKIIFYDLTEALLASSVKRIQYYGIARTVIEAGKEIALIGDNVRFVVYSFGKKKFFEVGFQVHADESISFDLPKDVGQKWFRMRYGGLGLLSAAAGILGIGVSWKNRKIWKDRASALSEASMSEGLFVTAARPKLIVDMIKTLERDAPGVHIVPLLHDFMPLHHGATKRYRRFDRNFLTDNCFVIHHSDKILTNSQFTRDELLRFSAAGLLPQPREISVVPLVHQCPDGTEAASLNLPEAPYIMTVGLNLGRKNIEVVLEAMKRMAESQRPFPSLVIAGAVRKRLRHYVQRPEFEAFYDKVVFVSSPHQTDLVRLYSQALALVIPSRMEGWGLPAGEALWCGTPAICSTAPVFKEVCGDLGLYFDPDDPDALATILQQLLTDQIYQDELRARIATAKPSLRTWRNVAEDILKATV